MLYSEYLAIRETDNGYALRRVSILKGEKRDWEHIGGSHFENVGEHYVVFGFGRILDVKHDLQKAKDIAYDYVRDWAQKGRQRYTDLELIDSTTGEGRAREAEMTSSAP
jgi:hypothetical protein